MKIKKRKVCVNHGIVYEWYMYIDKFRKKPFYRCAKCSLERCKNYRNDSDKKEKIKKLLQKWRDKNKNYNKEWKEKNKESWKKYDREYRREYRAKKKLHDTQSEA